MHALALAASHSARLAVLGKQPGELLAGVVADLHRVTQYHPFALTGEPQIAEFDQLPLNTTVAGILVANERKSHRLSARQKIDRLIDAR